MSTDIEQDKGSGKGEGKGNDNDMQVYNEHEAAKLLGVSVHALRKWRFEGRPPAYVKQGVRIGYLREDLASYLHTVRIEPRRQ